MSSGNLAARTAAALRARRRDVRHLRAVVGLDGFVDEIIRVVDKRDARGMPTLLPTMTAFAERIRRAAGRSTNLEWIVQQVKLGGNGPIMANALAALGARVTYIGNLGFPQIHPVFADMARRTRVFSLANPAHTDAVEFDDGKIMCGKLEPLQEVNWRNLTRRVGIERLRREFARAELVALVNWTMLPHLSDIWRHLLAEVCPRLTGAPVRAIFFDLADPEKRVASDLRAALKLMTRFQKFYRVLLGLNEKEAAQVAAVLGAAPSAKGRDRVAATADVIRRKLGLDAVVVHPTACAAVATAEGTVRVDGPYTPRPLISTGAGDHFNAGFCLGVSLGFDPAACLQVGVATSGFYVRTAKSPTVDDLVRFLATL